MFKDRHLRFWLLLFLLVVSSCKPYYYIRQSDKKVIAVDSVNAVKEDSTSLQILMPYKLRIESELNEVLAYSEEAMEKDFPEGKLNNFIADLTLQIARKYYKSEDGSTVDICLLNSGGLRASLPKGAITASKVFELMPFENKLVVLTLDGEKAMAMFNWIASNGGAPVSGAKIGIQNDKAVEIFVNGEAFTKNRNYKVVTSDYLAAGGDKYSFFLEPVKYEEINILAREAIIEYMKEETAAGRTLRAILDKRIYYVE